MNPAVGISPARGILWREWRAHRTLVFNFLTAWLVCLWIVPIFHSPAWILAFGAVYALVAGPAFGGSEVQDGTEEFSFALPPTRGERYVARMLLGGGTVLGFVGLGDLAVAFSLPQKAWGLFFESGLTEPFPAVATRFLWPMSIVAPTALYAGAFVVASAASSRTMVSSSWFFAAAGAGAIAGFAFFAENALWQKYTGWIAVPSLAVLALAAPAAGYVLYRGKEAASDPDGGGRTQAVVWILVALLVVFLLFGLFISG